MPGKWFKNAIYKKPPFHLGWKKNQTTNTRRRNALASRPKAWRTERKYLSVGRALTSLSNVTKDKRTKTLAKQDAKYFFGLLKKRR